MLRKSYSIITVIVLLLTLLLPIRSYAATDASIVSANAITSLDASNYVTKFTLDASFTDTQISQPQANPLYRDAIEASVFLNGVSVGEINDGTNDYNIMFIFNDNATIDLVIGKTRLDPTRRVVFEIRTPLAVGSNTISAVKMVYDPVATKWYNITAGETVPAEVTGRNVTAEGAYHILRFSLSTPVTEAVIANAQANANYSAAVKGNIFINGKSIGEWCTQGGHDYIVMVNIQPPLSGYKGYLELWVDTVNILGVTGTAATEVEIKTGAAIGDYTLQPMHLVYDSASSSWKSYSAPGGTEYDVTITGGGAVAQVPGQNYYRTALAFDQSVSDALISNLQAAGSYVSLIKSSLFINDKSVGEWCTQIGHDYAIMVNIQPPEGVGHGTLDLWFDKPNSIGMGPDLDATIEIKNVIAIGDAQIQPVKLYYDADTAVWSETEPGGGGDPPSGPFDVTIAAGSAIVQVPGQNYYNTAFAFDKSVSDTLLSNLQATGSYVSLIKNNLFINGKSIGEWCTQIGHDYAIMVNIQPPEGTGHGSLELWFDKPNVIGIAPDAYASMEIKTAITIGDATIKPVKLSYNTELAVWGAYTDPPAPDDTPFDVTVSGGETLAQSADDSNFYTTNFPFDKTVSDVLMANLQAGTEFGAAVKNSIFINNKSLGDWCTTATHDYAAIINIQPPGDYPFGSLNLWFEKGNVIGVAPNKTTVLEIRTPITIGLATIQPAAFSYDTAAQKWVTYVPVPPSNDPYDVKVTSGSEIKPQEAFYTVKFYFDRKVTDALLSNSQAAGDALAQQIKSKLFINGKSIGQWCEQAGHDYAVMVNIQPPAGDNYGCFDLWLDKTNIVGLSPDGVSAFEIRQPITIGKATIQPVSYAYNPEAKVWTTFTGEFFTPVKLIAGGEIIKEGNFFHTRFTLDTQLTGALLTNLQADAELGKAFKESIYFNDKSLAEWCKQAGHDYAAMINIQPPSGSDKGYIEVWLDATNIIGMNQTAKTKFEIRKAIRFGSFEIQTVGFSYNAATKSWVQNASVGPVTGEPPVVWPVIMVCVALAVLCLTFRKRSIFNMSGGAV